jgi:hypothetical protein
LLLFTWSSSLDVFHSNHFISNRTWTTTARCKWVAAASTSVLRWIFARSSWAVLRAAVFSNDLLFFRSKSRGRADLAFGGTRVLKGVDLNCVELFLHREW